MHEVIMPKLGLTMESGKIEKWHKKEGDRVEAGDILFEVMTDKVSLEVESYNSGILKKIFFGEGEEVPVTRIVAYIGEENENVPKEESQPKAAADALGEQQAELTEEPSLSGQDIISEGKSAGEAGRISISPLARKMADENNIDIKKISGTGPRGRIVKEDIVSYIKTGKEEKKAPVRIKISPLARKTAAELGIDYGAVKISGSGPEGRIVKEDILAYAKTAETARTVIPIGPVAVKSTTMLAGMRKIIAQRMSQSKSTIPHIVLNSKADATDLIDLREKLKETMEVKYGVKITFTDFILKATAMALREYIEVNSSLQENNFIVYEDINVGMAVSVSQGLIVPTIFGADRLEIFEIAEKRIELIEKARDSKLSLEEISNGTFTVTNLGMFGIRNFSAIINPPQAAILAVGEIYQEPAVVEGRIEPRSFIEFSLACDHRIVDGVLGAKYLQKLVEFIENPVMLVI